MSPETGRPQKRNFRVNTGSGSLHSLTEKFPRLQGGADTVGKVVGPKSASWPVRRNVTGNLGGSTTEDR